MKTSKQYIIRSTEREEPIGYFVAIHSFTPFYSTADKARRFESEKLAQDFARAELFTDDRAFSLVPVQEKELA